MENEKIDQSRMLEAVKLAKKNLKRKKKQPARPNPKAVGGLAKKAQLKKKARTSGLSKRKTESPSCEKPLTEAVPIPEDPVVHKLSRFEYHSDGRLLTAESPDHKELKGYTKALAVDCEMVGVGPSKKSYLAKVSIVNEHGFCLYNEFAKPPEEVTDYRTQFSGIRKEDLDGAPEFNTVAKEVAERVKDHILVGHSLEHDLIALGLDKTFPIEACRDTAIYFTVESPRPQAPKLKDLVWNHLNIKIQTGEQGHSPIIDAQAAMAIYRNPKINWNHMNEHTVNLRKRLWQLQRKMSFL